MSMTACPLARSISQVSIETSRKYLQEVISYQAKAIDGTYDGQSPFGIGGGTFNCPTEGCK